MLFLALAMWGRPSRRAGTVAERLCKRSVRTKVLAPRALKDDSVSGVFEILDLGTVGQNWPQKLQQIAASTLSSVVPCLAGGQSLIWEARDAQRDGGEVVRCVGCRILSLSPNFTARCCRQHVKDSSVTMNGTRS